METKTVGNLEWQVNVLDNRMNCKEADEYVVSLGDGWRLPTRRELDTLFDEKLTNPACSVFPECPPHFFWTSTEWAHHVVPSNGKPRWAFNFGIGFPIALDPDKNKCYVRCVRDVQA